MAERNETNGRASMARRWVFHEKSKKARHVQSLLDAVMLYCCTAKTLRAKRGSHDFVHKSKALVFRVRSKQRLAASEQLSI